MDVKNFPEALRLSRKLKDLSQGDVGVAVGASQQTVAGWERGRSMPRRAVYAKLVELFGADSLVATFPPKDEDLLPEVLERTAGYAKLDPVHLKTPLKAAEPRTFYTQTSPVPMDQRAVINGIRSAIPEKLLPALGVTLEHRGHYYFATYQSDRVCLVCLQYRIASVVTLAIRRETESPDRYRMAIRAAVRRAAREAIHQLVILRAINKLAGSDERTYVATVTPIDAAIGLDGLMPPQIEDEAYLLNLRCYHATTPAVVASIITSHEEPEQIGVDYFDDFIDGQAP